MKHTALLLIFILPCLFSSAQQPAPGGVTGAKLWQVAQNATSGTGRLQPRLKGMPDSSLVISGKAHTMNQNPALLFDATTKGIESTLNLGQLKSFSLFTVCQQQDTAKEQTILSLENDTATEMMMTSQRMALLDAIRYANYSKKKNFPRIYSYTQNKTEQTSGGNKTLKFGQPNRKQSLPVSAYNGLVPEVIVFNRNLSYHERLQVESYLALKYGVSLNQENPVSYVNSQSEVIWDADLNLKYPNNIAGVGRDDRSGLNQQTSESLQTPGLMKITLANTPNDNTFLIWGDDGNEPNFTDSDNEVRSLDKNWKINAFKSSNTTVSVEANVLSLSEINPLSTNETYWLMVDKTGTGTYPAGKTSYVPCSPMASTRGTIHFDKVVFDRDSSGSDVFTLLAAPLLFTKSAVVGATCIQTTSGKIQTDIVGGTAPYHIQVQGIDNTSFQTSLSTSSQTATFEGMEQGAYTLKATDANGQVYNETVRLTNQHVWTNTLETSYTLHKGQTLELDASKGMPVNNFTYQWKTPDGTSIQDEKIAISEAGKYLLSVTDGQGCNATSEVKVKQLGASALKNAELFPNPVTNGWFAVRISLDRTADVHLSISDLSGRVVKEADLKNQDYYWYDGYISASGTFLVTLTTSTSKETFKLIVQ